MSTKLILRLWVCALLLGNAAAQPALSDRPELMFQSKGNFLNQTARPLRYWPVGTDFVITNGAEFFNRPLYARNSGFRIDAGDRPECSLYLPGRGGNLRFGVRTSDGVRWLKDAAQIVARYRPGSLLYEIRDPLLGGGTLELDVLPLSGAKGLIARAAVHGASGPVELFWAFGGANGMKGRRGGDIGCERQPVREFFQLRPEQCAGDTFTIAANTFSLKGKTSTIAGVASAGAVFSVASAEVWADPVALLRSAGGASALPVIVGRQALSPGEPVYLALQAGSNAPSAAALPEMFSAAERQRQSIADRVRVETPDPYINAAAAALNIAADAVWDENQSSYMHGAVAWRTRLLGWRGPYAGDALGWHERTAAHFAGYARQQNTHPIPETLPPADETYHLARNEAALHSNGDLMNRSHYDMNLVAVDAFFRHLLWTGDTNEARAQWPVIARHLAWERRLFRREYGAEPLPLYEAYAAIWASDDLGYNGGGTTHASAYNYFENTQAARVAAALGEDPAPFQREADLILRGMNRHLWLEEEGSFAEFRDYLGLQRAHPAGGLWTFYHTLDSGVPTPRQAWQMARWVDTHLAHIPIQISDGSGESGTAAEKMAVKNVPGVETNLYTLPETSWMPYQWSLNNVVMAEAAHAALGFWQAHRPESAFALFKGELLDSMYLGLCPGNLGAMTSHDMARGEAQRDFADAIGVNARALVEGLFGVRPDALAGELKIVPGFPAGWEQARLRHPDLAFAFERAGGTDAYSVVPAFPRPMRLKLEIVARGSAAAVTVNGQPAKWGWCEEGFGARRLEIESPASEKFDVVVRWSGALPPSSVPVSNAGEPGNAVNGMDREGFDWARKISSGVHWEPVDLTAFFNDRVTRIFQNHYRAPRSPFCSLATPEQGIGGWCEPEATFEVDDTGLRAAAAAHGGRLLLPNGVPLSTPPAAGVNNILFTSQWEHYPSEKTVPLKGKASHLFLLMAGSTSAMQSQFDNGEIVARYADGSTARLPLRNPVNWWPIEQDYFIDDYAFRREEPIPPRVDLKTGRVRLLEVKTFKGKGGAIPGGAATVLEMPLNKNRELKSLTVRALANEVVIGLMAVTLQRE